ncbi:hypothetical protein AMS68_002436 [Peltaster fructicola]|uniref:Uncharacterized protein n=1 Tax=Peltaster fructicola TaxID=286661 RepID=A0A6H0XQM3_9PEZI|nr:hypothetical protein AMS68_002436 [Peltaster fructicola]
MARLDSIAVRVLTLAVCVIAAPIGQRSIPAWITDIFNPSRGDGDSTAQIQCYALPYGELGIVSHFLTYLTVILLICGQEPLRPWMKLKQAKLARIWNTILGAVSLVVTVCIAGFTMKSCRGDWPFVLLAFWKLTLSFSVGMLNVISPWHHNYHMKKIEQFLARNTDKAGSDNDTIKDLPLTTLPYLIGTLVGIVGLFDLVHVNFKVNRAVWILAITLIACVSFVTFCAVISAIFIYQEDGPKELFSYFGAALLLFSCIFIVAVVFFSDLVLAALNNNWSGYPSGDYALLFWLYFACKRLPMLSL